MKLVTVSKQRIPAAFCKLPPLNTNPIKKINGNNNGHHKKPRNLKKTDLN